MAVQAASTEKRDPKFNEAFAAVFHDIFVRVEAWTEPDGWAGAQANGR